MSIRWHKVDEYHCRSECGAYTVAKIHYAGTVFYEAYNGKTFLQREEASDSTGMRRHCEQHKAKISGAAVHHHENGDGV